MSHNQPATRGEALGHGMPDWPEDLQTFAERMAYQRGVGDARRLAATLPPSSSGPCEHIFDFQATVYWNDETKRLPGSDAVNRMYGDRYFCTKCLFCKIVNERAKGNSYGKPAEGTLPK